MKRLLNSVVLFIVAVVLAAALFPLGFATEVLFNIRHLRTKLADFLYSIALGIDKIGNVVLGTLFNRIMIVKKYKAYPFGDVNDTISYVLARNLPVTVIRFKFRKKETKVLTKLGWWLVCVLEKLDPDHMAKSRKRRY